MAGQIDPRISDVADQFSWIEGNPGASAEVLNALEANIIDGPLTQGLGGVHHAMSANAEAFFTAVRGGIADTGLILKQVHDEYQNIDRSTAESIDMLFAPPPGASGATAPEGGQ